MSENHENRRPGGAPRQSVVAATLDLLASFRVAVSIVAVLALVCIVGTLLPQGDEVGRYVASHPAAEGRMELLAKLGFTDIFTSRGFVVLLCVFAASLLTCTARRFAAIRRVTGPARVRVLGSFITHVSILLVLVGGVIRTQWGERGMLHIEEGQTAAQYMSRDGTNLPLPFAVRLLKFEIERYEPSAAQGSSKIGTLAVQWPDKGIEQSFPVELNQELVVAPPGNTQPENICRLRVTRYLPDFMVGSNAKEPVSRSDEPNNPAVQVTVAFGDHTSPEWVFARFPDFNAHGSGTTHPLRFRFLPAAEPAAMGGPVKAFKSSVQIVDNGVAAAEQVIRVNAPLAHKGYTLYQSGYSRHGAVWVSSLQVVRDPGVPLVNTAFVLMMIGLTMVFCVAPWLSGGQAKPGDKS